VSLLTTLSDAWRKNAPEALGFLNGALPDFVTAQRPREELHGVPVFAYHLVDADTFEADLEFLTTNGYQALSGTEFVNYLEGPGDVNPRSVMLTFDDGPKNFFEIAFPILRRHGVRAVAFIAPGLHADTSSDDVTDARPMTWQEIAAIHASGLVEFQSHTLESRFVPNWPQAVPLAACDPAIERKRRRSPLPFEADLALSRRELEEHLPGARVDQLAFPMYLGTRAAVEAAQKARFRACYWGLIPGRPVNRRGDSPFYVSRLSDEFLRRLPGTGRVTIYEMLRARRLRIREGRAWRRRFPTDRK
jgi:peptidoglycan/xylan/chitin deacetylase (PgdA/CDA1 family)